MADRSPVTMRHYAEMSDPYRRWWAPALEALVADFLDSVAPLALGTILDLGCGAGHSGARLVRARGGAAANAPRLVGIDPVAEMLREARDLIPDGFFIRGDATKLPFPGRRFSLVVSTFVMQHVREQHRVMAEVARVLEPGGRLALVIWTDRETPCAAMDEWDQLLADCGGPAEDPEQPPAWSEAIGSAELIGKLLTSLGFDIERIDTRTGSYRWTAETLTGMRRNVGGGARRYRLIPAHRRAEFDRRAAAMLATLDAEAFHWRPAFITVIARTIPAIEGASCDHRTICPNCGAAMYDRGCKTRCSRCHYFTDCSDPW